MPAPLGLKASFRGQNSSRNDLTVSVCIYNLSGHFDWREAPPCFGRVQVAERNGEIFIDNGAGIWTRAGVAMIYLSIYEPNAGHGWDSNKKPRVIYIAQGFLFVMTSTQGLQRIGELWNYQILQIRCDVARASTSSG